MPPRASTSATTSRDTNLDHLHPAMRDAVAAVMRDLQRERIPLFVFEAFRSPERQAYLYAQGRTRPGRIVTYAESWRSYHQYGLAVDLVFGGPGRWTWDEPRRGMWKKMHEIGRSHGLMPLDFETPHLQLSGTSSSALISGRYPSGGDSRWADNLNAAISGWRGRPTAPPRATLPRSRGSETPRPAVSIALESRATPNNGVDKIVTIAATSPINRYRWPDRGRAPQGFINGMAVTFARSHARLGSRDQFVVAMARPLADAGKDALAYYADEFASRGLAEGDSAADRLRRLFVLMIGLGMRESSGRHCEGRDRSASNSTAETAEAGLFQVSYNARRSDPLLVRLFEAYRQEPRGFVDIFKIGVTCAPRDWANSGSGAGAEFQNLSKKCPAFAVEFAAIALRSNRRHWGPITRMEAEVHPECDALLRKVQDEVDRDPSAYAGMS